MSTVTSTNRQTSEGQVVTQLPMAEVFADEHFNCRGHIAPIDVIDLAKNIQEQGLIQPIIVQPYVRGPLGTKWRVVAGYRRYMAHRVNKAAMIDCIIRDDLTDQDAKILNLSENLNREDLNMMQEARAIKELFESKLLTQQEIAAKLNMSRSWVQLRLYALKLPEEIQKEIEAGWLRSEHIHALNGLNPEEQYALVKEIKDKKQTEGQRARVKVSKKKIKKDPAVKMKRDHDQINAMLDHVLDSIGSNFGTRCLAWAAGNIPSDELFQDIREIAVEKGLPYQPPKDDV